MSGEDTPGRRDPWDRLLDVAGEVGRCRQLLDAHAAGWTDCPTTVARLGERVEAIASAVSSTWPR